MLHQAVKASGKKGTDGRFAFSRNPSGGHGVVALFQIGKHLRQKCRRVLQIRIHNNHIVAFCLFQSGIHGRFLSEVAGKRKQSDTAVLFMQLADLLNGSVLRTVIHIKDFKIYLFLLQKTRVFAEFPIEIRDIFFFVIARYNHA